MLHKATVSNLEGKVIKEIFSNAERVAKLHNALASSRGSHFRRKLLHTLGVEVDFSDIEKLRLEVGLQESQRHLNKLLEFELIKEEAAQGDLKKYSRTLLGEEAINALRALEREMDKKEADKIYSASLGQNSIKLFLKVYGNKKDDDLENLEKREIRYTAMEIGKMSLFLPRTIEGIAAIDKLSDAELLVYKEEGYIYLAPKKARAFYNYLGLLYRIIFHSN